MWKNIEGIGFKLLKEIDPEYAHQLALLRLRIIPVSTKNIRAFNNLKTSVAGIKLDNPIGLAAGFDKNAFVLNALSKLGFGFLEVGAVTPKSQFGNPKPRVFRIKEKNAIINRLGFNNIGMLKVNNRLKKFSKRCIIGLNIGANRDTNDKINDYSTVLNHCAENLHFATINISSPNTKNLRELQTSSYLQELLATVQSTNKNLKKPVRIFLKISPELDIPDLERIANVCRANRISGIIATNTSTDLSEIRSFSHLTSGGLSGRPLFPKSTRILARLSVISQGEIPLIGVGGVTSGRDAFMKISAGASAIQLYTALTYFGQDLIPKILKELDEAIRANGFKNVNEVIGVNKKGFF